MPSVPHDSLGRVVVFGYGAQGSAQALNLHDAGVDVSVALRPESPRREAVRAAGLACVGLEEGARAADLAALLVPDEVHADLYRTVLAPLLRPGAALVFAHGYSVHYRRIAPRDDLDVVLVAPMGIGPQVRARFLAGSGVPALLAVARDASGRAAERARRYAEALGCGRRTILETSFAEETETDLFAEQAVICGGLTRLITTGFETLVEAGYRPEIAYFCCLEELKLIADLVYERGLEGMRRSISTTALYGDYTRGPRVVGEESRRAMRAVLEEIRDGTFDRELAREAAVGWPTVRDARARAERHPIERVRRTLREDDP
jgi:ketol-acid reductoisomerase